MGTRTSMTVLAAALICIPWIAAGVAADDAQTFLQEEPGGLFTAEYRFPGSDPGRRAALRPAQPSVTPLRGEILWHNSFSDAICQTTGISVSTACLCAGTWLNPPQEVELIPIEGDGTPDWTYPGSDFRTAASRYGEVVAGVDKLGSILTLYKWHAGSAVPDWQYTIPSATVMGVNSLVVSPDASTIGLLVTMQDPQFVRLYCFDSSSPTPLVTYDTPPGGTSGNIDITADGRYIAFHAAAVAYVLDRDTQTLRWSGSMGGGNDPLAISGDGHYLAYGWTSLVVREWNGSVYNIAWTIPGGNFWLKSCRFSHDATTLVAGWCDHNTYLQNRIQLFELPVSVPLWTYLYDVGSGGYQDIPYEIAVTSDGGHLAVGSWGDEANTNPEIHVFEHASPEPILTVDTPGSMFDIDIVEDGLGCVYVAACGKHIHANENGRGGDLYSIRLTDPAAITNRDIDHGTAPLLLHTSPNPFTRSMTARCVLPAAARARLQIYSPAGRLLQVVGAGFASGTHSLVWDGRDGAGQLVEPGVYFMRLEAGGHSISRRVVRIE